MIDGADAIEGIWRAFRTTMGDSQIVRVPMGFFFVEAGCGVCLLRGSESRQRKGPKVEVPWRCIGSKLRYNRPIVRYQQIELDSTYLLLMPLKIEGFYSQTAGVTPMSLRNFHKGHHGRKGAGVAPGECLQDQRSRCCRTGLPNLALYRATYSHLHATLQTRPGRSAS